MRICCAALLVAAAFQDAAPRPENPESPLHPRRFGTPGGIGITRGWYLWRSWNAAAGEAVISPERGGEEFTAKVLPWATTYRHLAYGAHPDDLLPGERVNLFFNPEGKVKHAWLVHFQDEIGQMKGHNHAWQVEEIAGVGRGFTGRVMMGDKPFDPAPAAFELDRDCRVWRGGKTVDDAGLVKGERLYLTWCAEGTRRVVKLLADAASLDALQAESRKRVQERVARDGMGGFVEAVEDGRVRLLVFSTWWAQASVLKPGQGLTLKLGAESAELRIASLKNLGTYGSGPEEILLETLAPGKAELVRGWTAGKIVRIFPH